MGLALISAFFTVYCEAVKRFNAFIPNAPICFFINGDPLNIFYFLSAGASSISFFYESLFIIIIVVQIDELCKFINKSFKSQCFCFSVGRKNFIVLNVIVRSEPINKSFHKISALTFFFSFIV